MKIIIKTQTGSKQIELPEETAYFYATGIKNGACVLKMVVKSTGLPVIEDIRESSFYLDITCVQLRWTGYAVENFCLGFDHIEKIYSNSNDEHHELVVAMVNNSLRKITKEHFEDYLANSIKNF
jgi:hypothetical protein